jgi:hypothetical protein
MPPQPILPKGRLPHPQYLGPRKKGVVVTDAGGSPEVKTIEELTILTEPVADELYAPLDPSFVVMGLTAALPNERKLTSGDGVLVTDGGAGGNATLSARRKRSIVIDAAELMLDGDEAAPGEDEVYSTDYSATKGWNPRVTDNERIRTITAVYQNTAGDPLVATGQLIYVRVPANCVLLGWHIYADEVGDAEVDVLLNGVSIVNGQPPDLVNDQEDEDFSLNWDETAFVTGDILSFALDGAGDGVTWVTVQLVLEVVA